MVLPALREENLAKIEEENDKKFVVFPCQVGERRKVEKLFENYVLKQSKTYFKKTWNTMFDWSKKKVRSIEPGRGSQNF